MNFEIPPGLTDLLQEFTVAVLRTRPGNLEAFAADYFNSLNERVNGHTSGGLRFEESVNVIPQQENNTSFSDDEEEPIGMIDYDYDEYE